MKKLFLALILSVVFFSCSETTDVTEKADETEFIPLEYVKNYPDDLHLMKSVRERKRLYRDPDGTPKYLEIMTFTNEYFYHPNNTIKQIKEFWIKKNYKVNSDGTQGEEIKPLSIRNYYQRGYTDVQFEYENEKIVSRKKFNETIIDARCFHNYETDFQYNDLGKLQYYISRYKDVSNNKDWKVTANNVCNYLKDTIIVENRYNPNAFTPIKYVLDEYGNYDKNRFKNDANANVLYDEKNSPNDLIYPKYLLGWNESLYGSGNLIINGPEKYTHTYNEYGFPIQTKVVNTDAKATDSYTHTSTITYEYNK